MYPFKKTFEAVRPLPGYRLEVTLGNGSVVTVDLHTSMESGRLYALRDISLFERVKVMNDQLVFCDGEWPYVSLCGNDIINLMAFGSLERFAIPKELWG